MLSNSMQDMTTGWRRHWFIKNILAEIPFLGGFFYTENIPQALHHAGKTAAMLLGATTTMMHVLTPTKDDSLVMKMAKMTTSMAIGMSGGNMIYNCLESGGKMLFQYLSYKKTSITHEAIPQKLVELSTLRSDSDEFVVEDETKLASPKQLQQ